MDIEQNFTVYKNKDAITIGNYRFNDFLEIDLKDFSLQHYTSGDKEKNYGLKILDCYGILGVITLLSDTYLIVVSKVKCVVKFCKREIYKIEDTEFIPFGKISAGLIKEKELCEILEEGPEEGEGTPENQVLIQELKNVFNSGFYFSNKYDLANSIPSQNQMLQAKEGQNAPSNYDCIADGNKNYLANWKLAERLLSRDYSTRNFISNCIYGNIEQFSCDFNDDSVQIIMISRRSVIDFSIFNFQKGINKGGINSNQVETELILIQNSKNNSEIYSNIQLSCYLPAVFKDKDESVINQRFEKYFKNLVNEYNLILMVLLDNENQFWTSKFKELIHNNKKTFESFWKYFCIDSNNSDVQHFLKQNAKSGFDLTEIIGYTHSDIHLKYQKDFTQIGTFLLIGMNDVMLTRNQIYLTYKIIYEIYKNTRIHDIPFLNTLKENFKIDFDYNAGEALSEIKGPLFEFCKKFKSLFERRIQEISPQYYYSTNDFEKAKARQRVMELLFRNESKNLSYDEELSSLREEFTEFSELKIFVGTWNTGNTVLSKHPDITLDSWLKPKKEGLVPNIYFVGLQEVVELNASNIVTGEKKKILQDWAKLIEKTILTVGKYKKLIEMNLVGINFYCYVLEENFDNITNLNRKFVKTGLGGAAGNKGSCCINFNYNTTTISVACSHLAAGDSKNKQRLKEIINVLNLKTQEFEKSDENNILEISEEPMKDDAIDDMLSGMDDYTKKTSEFDRGENGKFCDSDIWILFGDLNFRVDLDYEDFQHFILSGANWDKVLQYDQFNKSKFASLKLNEIIEEDQLTFPPTYKYIIGSNEYDYTPSNKNEDKGDEDVNLNKSGKKRNPSWCDRILYKKDTYERKNYGKMIEGTEYRNVIDNNFQSSDHRPIYNIFDVLVYKEDKAKREKIEKELDENQRIHIDSNYLKGKKYNK